MPHNLVLFFDFDNTLTDGDLLDELIEAYSPNEAWRDWEHAWAQGKLPARDCLRLQVENMRVSRQTLFARLAQVRIDPAFVEIVEWARRRLVPVNIVSDSFMPLIAQVLHANGIAGIPIYANELGFAGDDRLIPLFPHYDASFPRSANAKAWHLTPYQGKRHIVFAGDGHSDLDAALVADIVFAKSTLARELDARGASFYPFETLEPVLAFLEAIGAELGAPAARVSL
jgi:2-hydroxy-3-keto-5-methylthiopentenyl-1-phosphate phosphatase